MTASGLSFAVLFALSLTGAWLDLSSRRLPNLLCLATAATGCMATFLTGGTEALAWAALHMALALAVGMLLFGLNMVGGGDAKFYAAVASWFPLSEAAKLLLMVSGSGLVLLVAWIVVRRITGQPLRPKTGSKFDGLPYGVAIASGAAIAALIRTQTKIPNWRYRDEAGALIADLLVAVPGVVAVAAAAYAPLDAPPVDEEDERPPKVLPPELPPPEVLPPEDELDPPELLVPPLEAEPPLEVD